MCKSCGCPAEGNAQKTLFVSGLTGQNCVATVEKVLLGLPGVYHVHIHAHDGETTVDYNPALTSFYEMTLALAALGFTAKPQI